MKSVVVSVQLGEQTLGQDWSGKALSNYQGIVVECGKKLAQHAWLLRVTGNALHLGLELIGSDRPLPVILQRLRVAQIIFDPVLDLRLRHHFIQWRLWIRVCLWPDPMSPVNFFDRPLISDTIRERQRSVLWDYRRGSG
jgi:hypothetical protein